MLYSIYEKNHFIKKSLYKNFLKACTVLSVSLYIYLPINANTAEPGVGNSRPAYGYGRLTDTNIDAALSKFRKDIYNPTYNLNAGTDGGGNFNNYLQANFGCANISKCHAANNDAAIIAMAEHFQDYALDLVWLRPEELPTPGSTLYNYTPGSDYNKQVYTLKGGSFEGYKTTIGPNNYYQFVPSSESLGGVANDPNNPNTGVYRDLFVDNATLNVEDNAMFISRPTSHINVVAAYDGATINFKGQHTYIVNIQGAKSHALSVGYVGDPTAKNPTATINAKNLTVIHGTGHMIAAMAYTRSIIVGLPTDMHSKGLTDPSNGYATLNVDGTLTIERRSWVEGGYNLNIYRNGIVNVTKDANILSEGNQQIVVSVNGGLFNVKNNLKVTQGLSGLWLNNDVGIGVEVSGGNLNVGNNFDLNTFVSNAVGVKLSSENGLVNGKEERMRGRFYVANDYNIQVGAQRYVDYTNNNATGKKNTVYKVVGLRGLEGDLKVDGNFKMALVNADESVGVSLSDSAVWIAGDMSTISEGRDNNINANSKLTGISLKGKTALLSVDGVSNVDMQTDQSVGVSVIQGRVYLGQQGVSSLSSTDFQNGNYLLVSKDIALLDLANGRVNTSGKDSQSIEIAAENSTEVQFSQAQGTTVSSSGNNSTSVQISSQTGKIGILSGGEITSSGDDAKAVNVSSISGNITLEQSSTGNIKTTGKDSDVVYVKNDDGSIKVIQQAGGVLNAAGESSNGLNVVAQSGDFDIELFGTTEMTTNKLQTNYGAVKLEGDGKLVVGQSAKILSNQKNAAILKTDNKNVDVSSAGQLVGSILLTGEGDNTLKLSGNSSSTISDMEKIDGGVGGATKLTLSGDLGTYVLNAYSDGNAISTGLQGETYSQILNWKNVELIAGAQLNMVGDVSQGNNLDIETFKIGSGSKLSKTHIQDTVLKSSLVDNEGIIDLRNVSDLANNSLEITGNYVGQSGSSLLVSTHWNNDPNPTMTDNVVSSLSETDHLEINGTASGSTTVFVKNNIIGDITISDLTDIGTYEKITKPVITVNTDHTNAAAVFTGSAQTTNAGEAQLVKRDNNYIFVLQAYNPDPTTEKPVVPIYSKAVSSYVQMPHANMALGYEMLGTFHERTGEPLVTQWDRCGYSCEPLVNTQSWVRVSGKHMELEGKHRFSYDADTYIAQIGQDLYTHYDENHQGAKTVFGIMGTYARMNNIKFYDKYRAENGVVVSDKHVGSGRVDAGGLGFYLTHIGARGAYLDVVGQLNYYSNKYDPRGGAKKESQNAYGVVLSAEVGAPYMIGQSHWYIEPQAQLIYQYLNLNDFHDGYRKVRQDSINGLRGRVGFRMAYNAPSEHQRTKTFFVKGNVWHDFNRSHDVAIGRDIIRETYNDTWGEIGLGLQIPVSKSAYLFSDVSYSHSFTNAKRQEYKGNLGLKVEW